MISCHEAIEKLWEYLDGTVEPVDHALIEEHLSRCLRCCGELEFARELRGFLQSSHEHIPPDVLQRLTRTIEEMDHP